MRSNFSRPSRSGLPASPGGVPAVGPSSVIAVPSVASSVALVSPWSVMPEKPV